MKVYYTQDKIASDFKKFFCSIFSLSKPILKNIVLIIVSMIDAESVVTSDFSRKFKDNFYSINLSSIERRCRRFFNSFYSISYSFYAAFIKHIISNYSIKHSNTIHISLDHMFCKDKFTVLLFSIRIGKQGIPIWFRCFKGKHNPDAYKESLIKEGISFCYNLFKDKNFHIIFLADRWFPNINVFQHISDLGCFYCFRSKSYFQYSYYNKNGVLVKSHLRDIRPLARNSKVLANVFYTRKLFKTSIVVSKSIDSSEPWYLITNDDSYQAVRSYSYRFGSIESIFKSQKSNGFRLESTNTQKIQHFVSLFTVMCIALVWLTIIGVDYVKNKNHYNLKIDDVKKSNHRPPKRLYSFFNLGLTIFNLCYYNYTDFKLKFNFHLYDV